MASMIRPIRIAHIALQLDTGGMERLLVEFARHVDRGRFELQFIAFGAKGRVAADIESCGWPVTALEEPAGVRPSLLYRLARLFRDQRIDVVHTHNTKPLLYAGLAARLARARGVIHTRHGQRHGASRRQNLLFHLASRCAHRVVCVSNDSARLCSSEGIDPRSIRTIWNGIDGARFAFSGPNVQGPAVFVGRLSPEKDVATLLRATAQVVARCPSFRLRIAGEGPCGGELAGLANSLELQNHVAFLGEVRDVPGLLHGASLFVLPSLTEGVPLTVLEAMACGLPVVTTRVGGTPEVVVEGATGFLVPAGQPSLLADGLFNLYRDHDRGRAMGIAGHQRVRSLFDVRTMVSKYESLYLDVLRSRNVLAA
jgi:glycosyltransferase involved in cell wall biosynthesis